MEVSIIIPCWNGRTLLKKHLPDVIEAKKNKENRIKEIIIVDDASTDNSVKFLENTFKNEIRLIKHSKNRGFSSAVNTGVRMAKGELVCLLNQDVSPESKFLEKVISHFADPKVFAVTLHERGFGPAIGSFKNGFLQHCGGKETKKTQNSFWASGGSAVFRRKTWLKLKGFDEELFNPFYWEDVDLSYRAQKRGFIILWEPSAVVSHEHESTINTSYFKKRKLNLIKERNQLLLIWKDMTSSSLIKKHIFALLKRALKNPGYFVVIFLALKKIRTILKLRKVEKKESKISDEAIFFHS